MSSQFIHFPDNDPLQIDEDDRRIFNKLSIKFSGIRQKMGETSHSKTAPPFARPSSSSSTTSHSTQDSPTQDDMILLIIDEYGESSTTQSPEEAPHYGSHRRIVSYDNTYQRNDDFKMEATAPDGASAILRPVSTSDLDQFDTKIQRRGAQRKGVPLSLRLRSSKSCQSLEILQPSPRSYHKTAQFLEQSNGH